ncbi:MAG: C40 family peptidase [Bernardetiaceae bacterium]|jgi:cell wall-associated NlpC family hydrolase|nr:C40 family peptidase [Bernardetiaceae bacterium]
MRALYVCCLLLSLAATPALAQTPPDSATTDPGARLATFAARYLGTPYVYAGKSEKGFDCSGFLYFVYKNFGVNVPAGSRAYAALGREVPLAEARPGDIMVFTGTNSAIREPGHVGIVYERLGTDLKFIHSSSAKTANCVTFNLLSKPSYTRRFLKVVRVLEFGEALK